MNLNALLLGRRLLSTAASTFRLPPTIRQLLTEEFSHENGKDQVTVHGWVKSVRRQKNISFAAITDGSTSAGLQAVFVGKDNGIAKQLTNGASVQLVGKLTESPGKGQEKEFLVESGTVLGTCDPELYPIQKQALSSEYLRDNAHLRTRTDTIAATWRLRDRVNRHIGSFFDTHGFVSINTPIVTASDAEGAGETFRVTSTTAVHPASNTDPLLPSAAASASDGKPPEFFGCPSFLTVSHQLHLEAIATAISRVYSLSPCFRAEPSATGRHLAEFWMLEAEWAFITPNSGPSLTTTADSRVNPVCNFVEACIRSIVTNMLPSSPETTKDPIGVEALQTLWKSNDPARLESLEKAFLSSEPWAKMTYTSAISTLQEHASRDPTAFEFAPRWGRGLQSEHERWLAEQLVGGPVFVTDYPASLKPFYMRMNDDGETVACFDLLVPHVGELVGGSVREERLEELEKRMDQHGMGGEDGSDDAYKWYKDLRRWGGAPHAGFGMGFERLIAWIGGVENVKECIPMPRWAGRMLL